MKCLWGIYEFPLLFLWLFFCLAVLDDDNSRGSLERSEGEAGGKRSQQSAFNLFSAQKFHKCNGDSYQCWLMGGKDAERDE